MHEETGQFLSRKHSLVTGILCIRYRLCYIRFGRHLFFGCMPRFSEFFPWFTLSVFHSVRVLPRFIRFEIRLARLISMFTGPMTFITIGVSVAGKHRLFHAYDLTVVQGRHFQVQDMP